MVKLNEILYVINIKDEKKFIKEESRNIRTVRLEGDTILLSIRDDKSDHPLGSLTEADLNIEAKLELDVSTTQTKLTDFEE